MGSPLELGPFRLHSLAGEGTTADVWRGEHRGTATPVAIKVLRGIAPDDHEARQRFAREVRAVARLDHAAIIRVYDYGDVPPDVAADSTGRLAAHAPYLVMDWHGGGTLRAHRGRMRFAALRAALLTLLDALAHAHARGVVHRDIKPANVLLGADGPVLTDFGVVFPLDEAEAEQNVWGTPNYMAPEQVTQDWRSYGPWTDLYAVGCVGWSMVTGRPPFGGKGALRAMMGHITGSLPVLVPLVQVPGEFELWLQRLLARDARDRFRFAADAAVALMAIAEGDAADLTTPERRPVAEVGEEDATIMAPPVFVALEETGWTAGPLPDRRPPMPADWRRPDPPWVAHLPDCGRKLAELRALRMRGREHERDRLWARLAEVALGQGPRAVVIEGGPGMGKSRLMRWLACRAHELGQADVMITTHAPTAGATHGIGRLLARHQRLDGLTADEAAALLTERLDIEPDLSAVLSVLGQPGMAGVVRGARVAIASEREMFTALLAALRALGRRRPLVVQLDDAHWAPETVRFVTHALDHALDLPALFVLTTRAADRAAPADALLQRLVQRPGTERLSLAPLDRDTQGALSGARLPLDQPTHQRLVASTGGNPLFADELLRHWLHIGALGTTTQGYRLRIEPDSAAPRSLGQLWQARLAAALESVEPDPMPALELAATLGARIAPAEWHAACVEAELPSPRLATERLLDAGLMSNESDGQLAFGHSLLRDALLERARRAGRLRWWHQACASAIVRAARQRGRIPDTLRQAAHLDAAGRAAESFPLWMEAARAVSGDGDMAVSGPQLLSAARAGRRLRLPRTDENWLELKVRWSAYLTYSLRGGGLRHAIQAYHRADDRPRIRASAARQVARCYLVVRDVPSARRWLGRAGMLADRCGDAAGVAATHDLQCIAALEAGELGLALRAGRAALSGFLALGDRVRQAAVFNQLGEVARRRGDLKGARRAYGDALRVVDDIDLVARSAFAANLALIYVEQGDWARARRRGRWARQRAARAGHVAYLAFADAVLLVCAAAQGDAEAWDASWPGLAPARDGRFVTLDVARCLNRAARLAASALPARAQAARAAATAQFRALGWHDSAGPTPRRPA